MDNKFITWQGSTAALMFLRNPALPYPTTAIHRPGRCPDDNALLSHSTVKDSVGFSTFRKTSHISGTLYTSNPTPQPPATPQSETVTYTPAPGFYNVGRLITVPIGAGRKSRVIDVRHLNDRHWYAVDISTSTRPAKKWFPQDTPDPLVINLADLPQHQNNSLVKAAPKRVA